MHELLSPRGPKECVFNSEAKQIQLHIINLQKCHPEKKEKLNPTGKGHQKKNQYILQREKWSMEKCRGHSEKSRLLSKGQHSLLEQSQGELRTPSPLLSAFLPQSRRVGRAFCLPCLWYIQKWDLLAVIVTEPRNALEIRKMNIKPRATYLPT